jgi:hypothetical protein
MLTIFFTFFEKLEHYDNNPVFKRKVQTFFQDSKIGHL